MRGKDRGAWRRPHLTVPARPSTLYRLPIRLQRWAASATGHSYCARSQSRREYSIGTFKSRSLCTSLKGKTAMSSTTGNWPRLQALLEDLPEAPSVSVAVRVPSTGATFDHQADLTQSSASTIKILILTALARAVDAGQLDLATRVAVQPAQLSAGSGILNELETPVELSLADHAHLMISISDNTASNVLIDAVGLEAIAATASAHNLTGTALQRRFLGRLPDPGTPENLTSANDLVTILTAIATNTAASPDLCDWMRQRLALQHYLNRLPRNLPAGVTFAGKSGSLEGFEHDCGILTGPNGQAIAAVMVRNVTDPYATDVVIGTIGRAIAEDANLA